MIGSVSDLMFNLGCLPALETTHGETVTVLSGADAGKSFTAVQEIEQDIVFDEQLGPDRRAHRILRFRNTAVPNITSRDRLQTSDGKTWSAVVRPGNAYLTTDFELLEIVAGKDS